MSIYRMNGKTKVAEITSQNVDWTTQINDIATDVATDVVNAKAPGIADSRINAKVPSMIVARNPYVAYSRLQKANADSFTATAPTPRRGYKFLCWVYTTTESQVAEWNLEFPDQSSTKCFYVAPQNFPGTHWIRNYALYVPIS